MNALLHRLIQGSGYLRGAPKEWFHFCVTGDDVEVIANFSLMDGRARIALIVRIGDSWHGDVEPIPASLVRAERGSMNLDFGQSTLRFDPASGFTLSIALSDHPLTATLHLEAETMPLLRPNTPLERDGAIHWMVVPRLRAHGTIFIGGERHNLENAAAYHDHNWGRFAWGDDLAWQWGFSIFARDERALAFVRLIDRARTRDVGHGLFLWRGAEQQRIFREGELTIAPSGFLRPQTLVQLPRTMSLLAPEAATDVPARIAILAEGRGDRLEVIFESERMLQLLIPNDRDLGVTAINEVSGRYFARGTIAGEHVELEGRGFFETLTIARGAALTAARGVIASHQRARGFSAFLRASLAILKHEAPAIYGAMCAALEGRVVRIAAGRDGVTLGFARTEAIECTGIAPLVELATDADTILDLCDAKLTLARAVREDRLHLRGSSADLIAFDESLMLYLAGAVRAPSFPALLDDYRSDARSTR